MSANIRESILLSTQIGERHVALDLREPGVYLICGPNSSGKTRLAREARKLFGAQAQDSVLSALLASQDVRWADLDGASRVRAVQEVVPGWNDAERHAYTLLVEHLQALGKIAELSETVGHLGHLVKRNAAINVTLQAIDAEALRHADRIRWAQEAEAVKTCPNCDALLKLDDSGELVPGDPEAGDLSPAPDDLETAKTRAEELRIEREKLEAERATNVARIRSTQGSPQSALRERITAIDDELQTLDPAVLERARNDEWHCTLSALNGALAAITPSEWREMLVFPDTHLAAAYSEHLVVDYGELSTSEQWICDAVLSAFFAAKTPGAVMVLDDMDKLDTGSRARCLSWLHDITPTDGLSLVFATMKAAPSSEAAEGAHVVWLPSL